MIEIVQDGDFWSKYWSNVRQLLGSVVAESPSECIRRVEQKFGARPTLSGVGHPGIDRIRDIVTSRIDHVDTRSMLCISLPHTHWVVSEPIILDFSEELTQYTIGPRPFDKEALYRPVSFVFHENLVYAYEWIDQSCPIDLDRFSAAYRAIENLRTEWPADLADFGLSIDARFMNIGAGLVIPTVEIGDDNADDPYYRARIFPEESAVDLLTNVEIEQVGWSASWPSSCESSEMRELADQILALPLWKRVSMVRNLRSEIIAREI